MIKQAFISNIGNQYLAAKMSDIHLLLAHINCPEYVNFWSNNTDNKEVILDNGAYENGYPVKEYELFRKAEKYNADIIVAPDYPKDIVNTLKSAEKFKKLAEKEGYKVMLVPHGTTVEEWKSCFVEMTKMINPNEDLIGISILAGPNAVENLNITDWLSRFYLLNEVKSVLETDTIHMLGLFNNPFEIKLIREYFEPYIHSWDSSMAVAASLRNYNLKADYSFYSKQEFDLCSSVKAKIADNINFLKELANG